MTFFRGGIYSKRAMKNMNKKKIIYPAVLYFVLCAITFAYGVPVNIDVNEIPTYELGPKYYLINPDAINRHIETLSKYNINDINDLKRAAISGEFPDRVSAYHILTLNFGSKAIPILQGCLDKTDNAYNSERTRIARYLALLGDKSGLERLRKEITALTNYDKETNSQTIKSDSNKKETPPLGIKTKEARIARCLEYAHVLAEFGDSFGYELAVKATSDKSSSKKVHAANILTNLSRLDKAEQKARGIDPEAALLSMLDNIESESDIYRLNGLILAEVLNNMRPESQVNFFDKCRKMSYLSDSDKQKYDRRVQRLQKQIELEKQAKAQENK
jgi:hypothetical protein